MAYQVLARKWRPKKFQDVIGQEHITRSLQNAIQRKKIGHAYLLTGTRGIGKTSVARIFAKALRCENLTEDINACGKCPSCQDFAGESSLNIHEIDGASNNSVENVRDLIGEVHFLPTNGKYRVYIIDEVHMLTPQAFNVLLKTLEEPPAHVIFIFATTEPDKLLGTVLSRCQRFDFKMASTSELFEHLKHIAKAEEIRFENDEAILAICREGRGSVRDTLTLLDQVLSFSQDKFIGEEILVMALGLARTSAIVEIVESVLKGDVDNVSKVYRGLLRENIPVKNITYSLLDQFFNLTQKSDYPKAEIFWIYENLAKDSMWGLASLAPDKVMEIALQKLALRRTFFSEEKPIIAKKKTWESFLTHLDEVSPVTASNLEQGNLVRPIEVRNGKISVEFGLPPSARVFYDYLNEEATLKRIEGYLSEYFGAKSDFIITMMATKEKFYSKAEMAQKEKDDLIKGKKEQILSHPMLKEAESLFNTKVDKVFIN